MGTRNVPGLGHDTGAHGGAESTSHEVEEEKDGMGEAITADPLSKIQSSEAVRDGRVGSRSVPGVGLSYPPCAPASCPGRAPATQRQHTEGARAHGGRESTPQEVEAAKVCTRRLLDLLTRCAFAWSMDR